MDGGLCSQMSMYIHGQHYRGYPLNIYYDIDWFRTCGKDMDGIFDRPLELTTLFPNLPFATLSRKQSKFYRLFFRYGQSNGFLPSPSSIRRTVYFYGYFDISQEEYNRLFEQIYKIENKPIKLRNDQIRKGNGITNCAVHIRRGDLANREFEWYKSTPDDYFFNSIEYVKNKYGKVFFFFFSDETDWVNKHICSIINADYKLMIGNKPYEDLLLISECDVVIASQGSFGRIGAKLNGHSELITMEMFYESIRRRHYI